MEPCHQHRNSPIEATTVANLISKDLKVAFVIRMARIRFDDNAAGKRFHKTTFIHVGGTKKHLSRIHFIRAVKTVGRIPSGFGSI